VAGDIHRTFLELLLATLDEDHVGAHAIALGADPVHLALYTVHKLTLSVPPGDYDAWRRDIRLQLRDEERWHAQARLQLEELDT
jgi:hypothetical protein